MVHPKRWTCQIANRTVHSVYHTISGRRLCEILYDNLQDVEETAEECAASVVKKAAEKAKENATASPKEAELLKITSLSFFDNAVTVSGLGDYDLPKEWRSKRK